MTEPSAVSHAIPADLDGDPGALTLLDWWQHERQRTGALPLRTALDPTAFLALLGAISLVDIEADGRLRLRLYGEKIAKIDPDDQRWTYLDELTPVGYRVRVLEDFHTMIAAGEPCGHRVQLRGMRGDEHVYHRQLLPLGDRDGRFRHILAFNPDALSTHAQRAAERLLSRWRHAERYAFSRE